MKIAYIKKLIELIKEMDVEEIEVKRFGTSVRIRKDSKGVNVVSKARDLGKNPVQELTVERVEEKREGKETVAVKAPMVGTFYKAPSPDAPPYVEIGDRISPGQIVCIIEAMKIMNEIESDVRGTVVDILVKNEDPVEFNQELFLIKPE